VLINSANDLVPEGGLRQVNEGLEPEPSQVESDDKRPSCPTSVLVRVNKLEFIVSGVLVVEGVVTWTTLEEPPPPPQAEINTLNKTAAARNRKKANWIIGFPLKTPRAHQICVIPLAHADAANSRIQ